MVLATDVFLGDPARFADSKVLASYVGMIPRGGPDAVAKLTPRVQR
jgi:hypothetical protein